MIAIKPHHFVDIITALGEGRTQFEPHPYGHAVPGVAAEILANPGVQLRIELDADDNRNPSARADCRVILADDEYYGRANEVGKDLEKCEKYERI